MTEDLPVRDGYNLDLGLLPIAESCTKTNNDLPIREGYTKLNEHFDENWTTDEWNIAKKKLAHIICAMTTCDLQDAIDKVIELDENKIIIGEKLSHDYSFNDLVDVARQLNTYMID